MTRSRRADLNEALERHTFGHAVICTFTFEPQFFEGYCLDQLKALSENNNVSVLLDQRCYDELTTAPASEWPRQANIRYLLHPIAVPGVFHPKLFLFASRERGLLVIGSANFTKAGLTSNAELVGVYHYERGKREQDLGIFSQAVQFISAVARRWPSADLDSNLADLLDDAEWLAEEAEIAPDSLRLLHNLERPLWPQIRDASAVPLDAVHVLSRYFDATPAALGRVRNDCKPKQMVLWTQNERTTMTPDWFRHPEIVAGTALVRHCEVTDEDREQPLHAKAVALVHGKRVRLAFGSANFTTAGLWSTADNGNVEIMLLAENLPLEVADPCRLFDPSGTAADLRDATCLRPAAREVREPRRALAVNLTEASLREHRLVCRCTFMSERSAPTEVKACLTFLDGGEARLRLQEATGSFEGQVDEAIVRRCSDGTVVVHVEARTNRSVVLSSNRVLLVNLQDIESGCARGRERRIRDAQRSAAKFVSILDELLRLEETDTLKAFLTFCDIPIIETARTFVPRTARPQWESAGCVRSLGERNLRAYASLHAAAIGFCDRHLRRVRRHCERASVAGVPNFMHIAFAVANVLATQVERVLIGLESTTTPLTSAEWAAHRQRLGEYLTKFSELIEVFYDEYVPALRKRFHAPAIREALLPDLQPLADVCITLLRVQERVEACRCGNLRVRATSGQSITPPIFSHDLLGPARWRKWQDVVGAGLKEVNQWKQAAA